MHFTQQTNTHKMRQLLCVRALHERSEGRDKTDEFSKEFVCRFRMDDAYPVHSNYNAILPMVHSLIRFVRIHLKL